MLCSLRLSGQENVFSTIIGQIWHCDVAPSFCTHEVTFFFFFLKSGRSFSPRGSRDVVSGVASDDQHKGRWSGHKERK